MNAVASVLLALGVAVEVVAVVGLVCMRDTYDRLHYVSLPSFGALLIAVAIVVSQSFSLIGDKALATAFVLVLFGPVLVHATARSFRVRDRGHWSVGPDADSERER